MKILILRTVHRPYDRMYCAGETLDVSPDLATELIERGVARLVGGDSEPDSADAGGLFVDAS